MKNTTNILLVGVIAILVVILFVGKGEPVEPVRLGGGAPNVLGHVTTNQTTTVVRDITGNEPLGSTTCYKILSDNSARRYARIETNFDEASEIRLYFGTTTDGESATTTIDLSTDCWEVGITLSTTTNKGVYEINDSNLWLGEIWGTATTASTSVRTLDI